MLTDKPYQFETLSLKCRNCLELLPTYHTLIVKWVLYSNWQALLNSHTQLLTALFIKMNTYKFTNSD